MTISRSRSHNVGRRAAWALSLLMVLGVAVAAMLSRVTSDPFPPREQKDAPAYVDEANAKGPAARAGTTKETRDELARARSLRLRVVDGKTGRPIAGARVHVAYGADESARTLAFRTGVDGTVSVSRDGAAFLAVEAKGHVPLLLAVQTTEAEWTLELQPTATLRVRVEDGQGGPIPDAPVRLVPEPASGPEWEADWLRETSRAALEAAVRTEQHFELLREEAKRAAAARPSGRRVTPEPDAAVDLTFHVRPDARTARLLSTPLRLGGRSLDPSARLVLDRLDQRTDEQGRAVFEGLPPGAYRWGLGLPFAARIEPLPAEPGVRFENGRIVHGKEPPPLLSGPVLLGPGEELEVRAVVRRPGGIRGSIPAAAGVPRVRVTVYSRGRKVPRDPGTPWVEVQRTEAFAELRPDGSFALSPIAPGPKALRAQWLAATNDVYFVDVDCEVPPGEVVDLGPLAPLTGLSQRMRILLRDTATREVLPPARILADPDARVLVHVETIPRDTSRFRPISAFVELPIGEVVRLHGLVSGRLWLRTDQDATGKGLQLQSIPHVEARIEDAPATEFVLPAKEDIVLAMPVSRLARWPLEIVAPPGTPDAELEVLLAPPSGPPQSLRASLRSERTQLTVAVQDVPHRLLVHSNRDRRQDAPALFGEARLDPAGARGSRRTLVRLHPAVTLVGRCFGEDGSAWSGVLSWSLASPQGRAFGEAYRVPVRDGSFVVHGVPPGALLRGRRPGTDLRARPTPGVQPVTLTIRAR